jgi:hypothetical protein
MVCVLLAPLHAVAGKILDSSVTRNDRFYQTSIDVRFDAPLAVVYRTITDYDNLAAINPSIEESRVLRVIGPQRYRVHSVIKICILVFCKRVNQVQDVVQKGTGSIEAVTFPADSDFRSGIARWKFSAAGLATNLHFTQEFEPDFWVPPVIGTWLIQRALRREVNETMMNVELIAREEAPK